jgi:2-keto-4-pentenoate hydratase
MAEFIGGRVVGWKVGATVYAVQLFEGHDGPIPGRIFADRCFDSPARIPADLFQGVKIECEFAFRLTRALPKEKEPLRPNDVAEFLTFHPAFELAGSRYAPGTGNRAATTFDCIADNGSGAAAVLGPAIEAWRDLPSETMAIKARSKTERRSKGSPAPTGTTRSRSPQKHSRIYVRAASTSGPATVCPPVPSRCRLRFARGRR